MHIKHDPRDDCIRVPFIHKKRDYSIAFVDDILLFF